jgi:hypothetical protein
MKSETITVRTLFENRRPYYVPFYQRAYSRLRRSARDEYGPGIQVFG